MKRKPLPKIEPPSVGVMKVCSLPTFAVAVYTAHGITKIGPERSTERAAINAWNNQQNKAGTK